MKTRFLTKICDLGIQAEIYPTHRVIREDYEEEPSDISYSPKAIFESSGVKQNVCCLPDISFTNLKYFLDGSRRTYVIGYMDYGEKFLPIVAGQAGAACCIREWKKIKKVRLDKNIYLLLPNIMEDYEIDKISRMLAAESLINVDVELYKYREDENKPAVEFAIAKLNSIMHEKELCIIKWLSENKKISTEALLVVDGSLQFQRTEGINFDNIVGVSKTPQINLSGITKSKKKHIGIILKDLDFAWRTPVFRVKDRAIGFWFLRIRQKKALASPLDGILKIEMFTQGNDEFLDSAIVDNVSKLLVLERNQVCYGADKRWHNLIYPIYVTEQLLKSSFLSDLFIINLF